MLAVVDVAELLADVVVVVELAVVDVAALLVDVVVVVGATDELVAVPKEYRDSLFAPPQISADAPLQAMLQPALPSGAGAPPFSSALPQ